MFILFICLKILENTFPQLNNLWVHQMTIFQVVNNHWTNMNCNFEMISLWPASTQHFKKQILPKFLTFDPNAVISMV